MEYKGTYLKYVATATGAFDLRRHEWKVVFWCGSKKVTFTKKNVGMPSSSPATRRIWG